MNDEERPQLQKRLHAKITMLRAGCQRCASKNRGYRYTLFLIDVFARRVQAEPDTVIAFEEATKDCARTSAPFV